MEINNGITVIIGTGKSEFLFNLYNEDNNTSKTYLKQNQTEEFFCNSVYEDMVYTLKKHGKKNIDSKIFNSLKMVDLVPLFLKRNFWSLSSGEQKQVALAKALLLNSNTLYLDEPFTCLDSINKKKMVKLFKMMKIRYGKKLIIALNDIDTAFNIADKIILIDNNDIKFIGNKYELFLENNYIKPNIVDFVDYARSKGLKLEYRDDISDVMKDIYRCVR